MQVAHARARTRGTRRFEKQQVPVRRILADTLAAEATYCICVRVLLGGYFLPKPSTYCHFIC